MKQNLTQNLLFFAFTFILITPKVFADIDSQILTHQYSPDLRYQFSPRVPLQVGQTCHISAAVALWEAACFKKTGKRVDISEGYQIYKHLEQQIQKRPSYDVLSFLLLKDGPLTDFDGGDIRDTLARLKAGNALVESEFTSESFYQKVRLFSSRFLSFVRDQIRQTLPSEHEKIQKHEASRFPEIFLANLEKSARESLNSSSLMVARFGQDPSRPLDFAPIDVKVKSLDSTLAQCSGFQEKSEDFRGFKYQFGNFEQKAVDLLKRGIPFACTKNLDVTTEEQAARGLKATEMHALVVVAYRYDYASKQHVFLARSSSHAGLVEFSKPCFKITYLDF